MGIRTRPRLGTRHPRQPVPHSLGWRRWCFWRMEDYASQGVGDGSHHRKLLCAAFLALMVSMASLSAAGVRAQIVLDFFPNRGDQ